MGGFETIVETMRLEKSPRACRIVCTLGPASRSVDVIEKLILAGMNVARLNFSHGDHESHKKCAERVRETAARVGRVVAVMQDLQGHKVRVGHLETEEPLSLETGSEITIGPGESVTPERIGIDYADVSESVLPGHHVYIDDGSIDVRVLSVRAGDLVCGVEVGGELKSRKGVIFPDSDLVFPPINEKDLEDARFGASLDVDMVAMSFVRSAEEIVKMRSSLAGWGVRDSFIVAKIEDRKGIENLDEIVEEADALLIARGDMGVTLPRERVPGIQKRILRKANARGVPVITATQMLESMTQHHKPTRAEVSDVHNAVLDGTDAVMLSGETASGRYPVESAREMDRICRAAEREMKHFARTLVVTGKEGIRDKMAEAASTLARNVDAVCMLGFSLSGSTLRALSVARCSVPVYGVVADSKLLRRLILSHGLSLATMPVKQNLSDLVDPMLDRLKEETIIASGDRVVVVTGVSEPGDRKSHLIKLYEIE